MTSQDPVEILIRLLGEAAFDFGVSVEWKRPGFQILKGAIGYVQRQARLDELGITEEDLADDRAATAEHRAHFIHEQRH